MRTEFLNLHDFMQYGLLSAIRGPEIVSLSPDDAGLPGIILKRIITRRIRSIIFYKHECEADYTDFPLRVKDVEALKTILALPLPHYSHFIFHLRMAVSISMTHPIWGGLGEELRSLLVRNTEISNR